MEYTIRVKYKDGNSSTWVVSDRHAAFFMLTTEIRRYGKNIVSAFVKGVKV